MKIEINILIVSAIIGILTLSGCVNLNEEKLTGSINNSDSEKEKLKNTIANISENNGSEIKVTYPLTLTDNLKRTVTINSEPQRIISLSPANTEILFALGLENKIVGVTNYCNYPEGAAGKPVVSEFGTVNLELVVNSSPDIVLMASGVQQKASLQLDNFGITLTAFDADTVSGVLENIELIGILTNRKKEAENLTGDMQRRIDSVKETAGDMKSKPGVFYIIWNDPLWTIGPDAFIEDAIEIAGGKNIFSYDLPKGAPTDYFITNKESVITRNPDIIIIDSHGIKETSIDDWLKKNGQWRDINAVKNKNIYFIDADIASRPGPRVVDALEKYSGWFENWE